MDDSVPSTPSHPPEGYSGSGKGKVKRRRARAKAPAGGLSDVKRLGYPKGR